MKDTPEELKPFYNENSEVDQLSRLSQLPDYLDRFGRGILDSRRYHYFNGKLQPIKCEINKINDLSSSERLSLFTALFPGIAVEVELTYEYFSELTKLSNFYFGSSPTAGTYENRHFKNTLWLTLFAGSIKGYEKQDLDWFVDHEKNFDLGILLAALIAKEDGIGKEVLEKVLLLPVSNKNVLTACLCTPLNIGENYLKNSLISAMGNRPFDCIDGSPIHPSVLKYIFQRAHDDKSNDYYYAIMRVSAYVHNCKYSDERQTETTKNVIEYIGDYEKVTRTIESGSPEDIYYALWTTALQDQKRAVQYLTQALESERLENRMSAVKVLVRLNIKEAIPLVLKCASDKDVSIPKYLFSPRYNGSTYFDIYLGCHQESLAESDLFERMEKLHRIAPEIISNPQNEFANYLGARSVRRLNFLGEFEIWNLYKFVYKLPVMVNKNQETINYLLDVIRKNFKRGKERFPKPIVYDIRSIALKGLVNIELTKDQLVRIMDAYAIGYDDFLFAQMPNNPSWPSANPQYDPKYYDFQVELSRFLLGQKEDNLWDLLSNSCNSRKKHVRLGAMKILLECKKEKRFGSRVQKLILNLRAKTNLTVAEIDFLDYFLDNKSETINYEDLLAKEKLVGARSLFAFLTIFRNYPIKNYNRVYLWKFIDAICKSSPASEDTKESFKELAQQYKISINRLIELSVNAPQWRGFVEYAIGVDKYTESLEWILSRVAGTNYYPYSLILENELGSWIVDGNKVNQIYRQLGEQNWNILLGIMISDSSTRMRAKIKTYTDVLTGKYTTEGLLISFKEMDEKKHAYARDFIVALGFLPFKQEPERMNDMVSRYQAIREYIRESRKFGDKRQTGNEEAASIGLKNLAHNAGYSDVKKFELAMEAEAVKDLASGPAILEVGEYKVSLFLNGLGEPKLELRKNDTVIKSFPDKLRNSEAVENLKNRVKQIKRQVGRLRNFLEESMCDSNEYSLFEFQGLMDHPILRLMMEQLVFISPKGMGYPTQKGSVLFAYDGTEILLENHEKLRIAHSYDLLTAGVWNQWQRECFDAKRIQPFKQVFREVYVLTDAEKNESHESHRFFGQIVKGRQALILLKSKGWKCQSLDVGGSCFAYKGFWHMRAILSTAFRMRDLENVGTVSFENNKINRIPLVDIPPIIFSEAIRDMDLVVSVAYAGDGGWEGTSSTIESRTALVRETCTLLHLGNVHIENNFAFVEGMLSSYKVHLGSGSIHQVPGNYVCVIPDNAKSIGNLFLPFIDKDQMTSIILSKIVLLAHDDKIKDPVILKQIKRID